MKKCVRLLHWVVFVDEYGPFFVHLFNNLNVQNILELETSERRPKQKTNAQNSDDILRTPFGSLGVFLLITKLTLKGPIFKEFFRILVFRAFPVTDKVLLFFGIVRLFPPKFLRPPPFGYDFLQQTGLMKKPKSFHFCGFRLRETFFEKFSFMLAKIEERQKGPPSGFVGTMQVF